MSILNLNGPAGRPARSKRAVKVWMGIGLVIAVLGVGSTLASTITINGGTNTEFGQGVSRTVYCGGDHQITVKPISSYSNNTETRSVVSEDPITHLDRNSESAPGYFYLSGISVSDIPEQCSGVDFVLSVYPPDGTAPVALASYTDPNTHMTSTLTTPTVYWERASGGDNALLSASRVHWVSAEPLAVIHPGVSGDFIIEFTAAFANTNINDVGRILIETQDDAISEDHASLGLPLVHGTRTHL
jgi:hypothetical protein